MQSYCCERFKIIYEDDIIKDVAGIVTKFDKEKYAINCSLGPTNMAVDVYIKYCPFCGKKIE